MVILELKNVGFTDNNLELPLLLHYPNLNLKQRMDRIHKYTELVEYQRPLSVSPSALSIGEQKKIGFARALICEPDLLFLDEPTESLDDKTAELFIQILQSFTAENKTIVFVSHDTNMINSFVCDKIFFADGEIKDKVVQESFMKFKIKHADQIAGALSILAIAALVFIIFLIGSTQKWFVPKHMYYTIIPTASITEGKAVTYKGFEIGKIKSIKLTDGDRVRVDFYITDEYVSKCVRDSIIEISVSPIGLSSSVIFYPGNSKALMGDGTFVPEKKLRRCKKTH